MDPPSGLVEVFSADGIEWQPFTPDTGFRSSVNALDEARKHSRVGVRGSCSEEDRVWMPCKRRDCAADGLLQVLGHPPVVLFFKVADCD